MCILNFDSYSLWQLHCSFLFPPRFSFQWYIKNEKQIKTELHKRIDEFHDIVRQETNKLCKEKEAFDEVAKKLEHVQFSEMLKLNVGSHMFTTSLETMTKYPGI